MDTKDAFSNFPRNTSWGLARDLLTALYWLFSAINNENSIFDVRGDKNILEKQSNKYHLNDREKVRLE